MNNFRDLGRSEHYFQGAREQGPPLGGPLGCMRCRVYKESL